MSKKKKYIFSNKEGAIRISLIASTDQEAISKLGTIVTNVDYFSKMKRYKLK